MLTESTMVVDPLIKFADYRKDIQDAVDNGEGLGLFGPMFVILYDALKVDRQTIATLTAQLETVQRELVRVKEMIRHSRYDIDALEELEEMVDADDWDDDEDEEAADNE